MGNVIVKDLKVNVELVRCLLAGSENLLLWQFGEILATTEHEEDIVMSEIDYSLIELRR